MENRKSISYGFEDIKRYRQGLMSREEMHAFEKASMEDPFLSDALEGYMQSDMALADEHLSNIGESVTAKKQEKEQAVVVNMPKKSFGFMRVAAMVIVIVGAGLITYKVLDNKKADGGKGELAGVTPQEIPPSQGSTSPGLSTDTNTTNGSLDKINVKPSGVTKGNKFTSASPKKIVSTGFAVKKQHDDKEELKDVAVRDAIIEDKSNAGRTEEVAVTSVPAQNRNAEANAKLKANHTNEIRGTILTPTNEPLANTNLRVDNLRKEIVTDNGGNFVFTNKDTVVNATITNGYFANTRVQLRANENNNINLGTIQMKQDEVFEKTVTVVGLGSKKAKVTDSANNKPVNGWGSFQDYVTKTLGKKIDSTNDEEDNSTEIEFFVDAKGKPRDIKVITTTDIDETRTKEIIEAVQKGPKWANKNQKTRIVIRY